MHFAVSACDCKAHSLAKLLPVPDLEQCLHPFGLFEQGRFVSKNRITTSDPQRPAPREWNAFLVKPGRYDGQ